MLYCGFDKDREYLINKFRKPQLDPSTGISNDAVIEQAAQLAQNLSGNPVAVIKARSFEFVCQQMMIDVNPHDCFPGFGCYERTKRPLKDVVSNFYWDVFNKYLKNSVDKMWNERQAAGLHTIWPDFDHSVPEWDNILALGFPGLRDRAKDFRRKHAANGTLNADTAAYFDGIEITLNAVLECIGRLIDYARQHHADNPRIQREIRSLEQLRNGAPQDSYDVLMIIYLFFYFGEYIDSMQVRSLGNLDAVLKPYCDRDLAQGRYTMEDIREFITCFLMQWGSIDNYWGHPFYLGGTAADGTTLYNEYSALILEIFDELAIPTPKIQLKIAANTPDWLLKQVLRMVRDHNSSLVFISEDNAREMLEKAGYTAEEARCCGIRGCYEIVSRQANTTSGGYLNVLKCVELAMNNGYSKIGNFQCRCGAVKLEDMKSFDDFFQAFLAYLDDSIKAILKIDLTQEAYLHLINPGHLYSSTVDNSLKLGVDAFSRGTVYKETSIGLSGLGTAVDALMAVKKAVFDEKMLSLTELRDILNQDWEGAEKLRLKLLYAPEKYGNGIAEVDKYADFIAKFAAARISNQPNARGGCFILSGHGARQFIVQGQRTGATPDGRKSGAEFSKNLSPAMGADTNGITALSNSICTMDFHDLPGDFPLDVMMHPATVQGEEGLEAMKNYIFAHFANGGMQIHFNIFDTETLRDAQAHPEKYQNLQVRVCGWNVRFVELDKKEQDMYIARALRIAE